MSQYLTSFLIEPVVRQARRFSRQSDDDRPFRTVDVQVSSEDGVEIHRRSCVHAEAVPPTDIRQMSPDRLDSQGTQTVPAEADTVEEHSLDVEVRAWRDLHQPPASSHEGSSTPATGSDSAPPNDQSSSNPVHGITVSLGSTTSSLSNPAHSVMDPDAMEIQVPAQPSIQSPTDNPGYQVGDRTLPADDGMGSKRRQIVAIHNTGSSNTEKARLVHNVMNGKYTTSQPNTQTTQPPLPTSQAGHGQPNPPTFGHIGNSFGTRMSSPTLLSANGDSDNPFNLSAEDLKPTYYQKPEIHPSGTGPENRSSNRLSQDSIPDSKILGCPHYKRNIKLQCSKCYRWYTCRFCHDEVEDHSLNRPETKNMLCMFCGCAQPASGACTRCGEPSARYYCAVCKFWDNNSGKSIYHCNDCGICRLGAGLGRDFFHCKTCNACMSMSLLDDHRCIERSTDCDCPICGEYMFTSPQTVVFMRCGHAIHRMCYYEHARRSYRCPICSKSMTNMEAQFRQLGRSIESQPMPPEYRDRKVWAYCNDCNAKSTVDYHWLGLKCGVCDSYNTATIKIIRGTDPTNAHSGPMSTTTAGQPQDQAVDNATQIQRATNSAPPPPVVPPPRIRRPSESQNLEEFAQETVAAGEHRVSMDALSDGEYSDVDFWGFESPNARGARASPDKPTEHDTSEDDSPGNANIDDECTAPGHADDDDDDDDEMEIFGHR